jgi:hypothetical protein
VTKVNHEAEKNFCGELLKEHISKHEYGKAAEMINSHKDRKEGRKIFLEVFLSEIKSNPGNATELISEAREKVPKEWTDHLSQVSLNYCLATSLYEEAWTIAHLQKDPRRTILEGGYTTMGTLINHKRQMSHQAIKLVRGIVKYAPEPYREDLYRNLQKKHTNLVVSGSKIYS